MAKKGLKKPLDQMAYRGPSSSSLAWFEKSDSFLPSFVYQHFSSSYCIPGLFFAAYGSHHT